MMCCSFLSTERSRTGTAGEGASRRGGGLKLREALPTEQRQRLHSRALIALGWSIGVVMLSLRGRMCFSVS